MKNSFLLLAALALVSSACSAQTSPSSSSAISQSTTQASTQSTAEATLVSPNAKAQVGPHRIEIEAGQIKVDGVSYGSAPAGAQVRFVFSNGQSALSVNGQPRGPARQ